MTHAVSGRAARTAFPSHVSEPALSAYWILRIGYAVLPIIAGADKFFHVLTDWERYLAPWAANRFGDAHQFMMFVGVVEIVAGIGVAFLPRIFAYVVAAWLLGIVINLLSFPGYYDIALRDFGLMLGAVALGLLSQRYGCRAPRPHD